MIIRTDAQWRELFQQHQASGLSSSQFCQQQKLCPKYFSLRKKQLGLEDKRPFVALQLETPSLKPIEQLPALTLLCSVQNCYRINCQIIYRTIWQDNSDSPTLTL